MSLMLALKLGLWNAWILNLPIVVLVFLAVNIFSKRESGEGTDTTSKENAIFNAHHLIFLFSSLYSIFLPLKLNSPWLLVGIIIFLPGLLIEVLSLLSFKKTSIDELVTEGIYSFSRHPIYLGFLFIKIGISVSCHSWVYLLFAITSLLLEIEMVNIEERLCLEEYGSAYEEYINSTPKWIGLPKKRIIINSCAEQTECARANSLNQDRDTKKP